MKILITGCAGLIGSEVCRYLGRKGHEIHGLDNNQRLILFGDQGDTRWNLGQLESQIKNFSHYNVDIRNRDRILSLIPEIKPDAVVHTAAQPSHDKAAQIPFEDFDINAVGTLNLLESVRRYSNQVPFVHMSTNKVYGDAPNKIPLIEKKTRWEYSDESFVHGIDENFQTDQSTHSLFGASKLAADVMVQQYGRYFNMPTCTLRGGCLTGPNHSGVQLHGFLSYLVKCNLAEDEYTIFGYKGKQVRDNIHSYDVARFIELYIEEPKNSEVYNIGGGYENTCSILEAFEIVESLTGKKQRYTYQDTARIGDHVCYYSDLRKMKSHYPKWNLSYMLKDIMKELVDGWNSRI